MARAFSLALFNARGVGAARLAPHRAQHQASLEAKKSSKGTRLILTAASANFLVFGIAAASF